MNDNIIASINRIVSRVIYLAIIGFLYRIEISNTVQAYVLISSSVLFTIFVFFTNEYHYRRAKINDIDINNKYDNEEKYIKYKYRDFQLAGKFVKYFRVEPIIWNIIIIIEIVKLINVGI